MKRQSFGTSTVRVTTFGTFWKRAERLRRLPTPFGDSESPRHLLGAGGPAVSCPDSTDSTLASANRIQSIELQRTATQVTCVSSTRQSHHDTYHMIDTSHDVMMMIRSGSGPARDMPRDMPHPVTVPSSWACRIAIESGCRLHVRPAQLAGSFPMHDRITAPPPAPPGGATRDAVRPA